MASGQFVSIFFCIVFLYLSDDETVIFFPVVFIILLARGQLFRENEVNGIPSPLEINKKRLYFTYKY